jgi:hypothetical protein
MVDAMNEPEVTLERARWLAVRATRRLTRRQLFNRALQQGWVTAPTPSDQKGKPHNIGRSDEKDQRYEWKMAVKKQRRNFRLLRKRVAA